MAGRLDGKVAIVTGGNSGIGEATAHLFAREGAKVALMARREEEGARVQDAIRGEGGDATYIQCDVTDRSAVDSAVEKAVQTYGGVDVLFNNAGHGARGNFPDEEDDAWDSVIEVNLNGTFYMSRAAWPHLIESGAGAIINMSSMAALRPLSRSFVYSLAKAGLLNLTQNLAREWAANGIRVNALCPGFFPAEQNRAILDEHRVEAIMRQTPMDRFGEPVELVGATLLLASQKAGSFITGSNLVVDGGFSVMAI